jgi:hypothetical protein
VNYAIPFADNSERLHRFLLEALCERIGVVSDGRMYLCTADELPSYIQGCYRTNLSCLGLDGFHKSARL